MGGGGFSDEASPALDDFVLALPEKDRPRVCFLAQATGDSDSYIIRFYEAFTARSCDPSHLALFRTPPPPVREHLLTQDVVYVGGGNTANMLALWRLHGVDQALRAAWEAGIILAHPRRTTRAAPPERAVSKEPVPPDGFVDARDCRSQRN